MFLNCDVLQNIFDNSDYFTMLNMMKCNKSLNACLDIRKLKAFTTLKKILNRKGIACVRSINHSNIFYFYDDATQKDTSSIVKGISVFGKDITKITIEVVNWSTLYVFHFTNANYVYLNHLTLFLYKLMYVNIIICVESSVVYKVTIHKQKETNFIQSNRTQKWHTYVKYKNDTIQNELVYDEGICCLRYGS